MRHLFFIGACLFVTLTFAQKNSGINFQSTPLSDALASAKSKDKLVFLVMCVEWSEPCDILAGYTLTDEKVGAYFNDNFINVRYNMDNEGMDSLADRYAVNSYPTMLFLNAMGEVVHQGCGAMNTGELLKLGRASTSDMNLKSAFRRFDEGELDPVFLIQFSQMLQDACISSGFIVDEYFKSASSEQMISQEGWDIVNLNAIDPYGKPFQFLLNNKSAFEALVGKDTVDAKIYGVLIDQLIDIYEGNDITLFASQAILALIEKYDFEGDDELTSLAYLKIHDLKGDWSGYAQAVLQVVKQQEVRDPDQLNEFGWKFYIYVNDRDALAQAVGWMDNVVNAYPAPTYMDTYASLLYKTGDKKKAVKMSKLALKQAEKLGEDVEHYEAQLAFFQD